MSPLVHGQTDTHKGQWNPASLSVRPGLLVFMWSLQFPPSPSVSLHILTETVELGVLVP